jgi:hypothetical protein
LKCQLGDVKAATKSKYHSCPQTSHYICQDTQPAAASKPVTPGPQQSPSNGSASSTTVDKPGDGAANVLSSSAVHHTYNVSTKNSFSALSDSISDRDDACSDSSASSVECNKRSPPLPAKPASTETKPSHLKHSASPRDQMLEKKVNANTTHLLLGDSVLRRLNGEVMFRSIKYQNLSVSGLSGADLLAWLSQTPVCPNVQAVVVHVGVNTCKSMDITESMWRNLLYSVGRCFPLAFIIASGIVPPRSSGPLRTTVQAANHALWKACDEEWMLFVDNEPTFITHNGAPRKKLYSDYIHPSDQGTELLMQSLIEMLHHADTLAYSSTTHQNLQSLMQQPGAANSPPSDKAPLLSDPDYPNLPQRETDTLVPTSFKQLSGASRTAAQSKGSRSQVPARQVDRGEQIPVLSGGRTNRDPSQGKSGRDLGGAPAERDLSREQRERDASRRRPTPDPNQAAATGLSPLNARPPWNGPATFVPHLMPACPQRRDNADLSRVADLPVSSSAAVLRADGRGTVQSQPPPIQSSDLHGLTPAGVLSAGGYSPLQCPLQMTTSQPRALPGPSTMPAGVLLTAGGYNGSVQQPLTTPHHAFCGPTPAGGLLAAGAFGPSYFQPYLVQPQWPYVTLPNNVYEQPAFQRTVQSLIPAH